MDALKERGIAAAAVVPAEAAPQGDEEAGSDEVVSNACTWPPPEAEYFFGECSWHDYFSYFCGLYLQGRLCHRSCPSSVRMQ